MKKVKPAGIAEIVFDCFYLALCVYLGVSTIIKHGSTDIGMLCGIMILTLGIGDSFHLIPRMLGHYHNDMAQRVKSLGYGKLITSITMTLFYVLMFVFLYGIKNGNIAIQWAITLHWSVIVCSSLRIFLCLLPGNGWEHGGNDNPAFTFLRNLVFTALGVLVLGQCTDLGSTGLYMMIAIVISFICYWGTVLFSGKNPKMGMLMIPKTCAYIWLMFLAISLL